MLALPVLTLRMCVVCDNPHQLLVHQKSNWTTVNNFVDHFHKVLKTQNLRGVSLKMSVPFTVRTHSRQVCSLYKRALRNLEAWYDRKNIFRYRAVLLRQRFEKNRCVTDMVEASRLLEAGEQELFNTKHFQPKYFANSPGGCAFEREVIPPDWVIDYWHPLEKAQYPEYFAKREQRKKEFVAWWEKQYGKPDPKDLGHH